jgi:hypothetical protein
MQTLFFKLMPLLVMFGVMQQPEKSGLVLLQIQQEHLRGTSSALILTSVRMHNPQMSFKE